MFYEMCEFTHKTAHETAMKFPGLLSHEISWVKPMKFHECCGEEQVMKFHAMKFPMKIS